MAVGEERRNSLARLGSDDRRSERDRRGKEGGGVGELLQGQGGSLCILQRVTVHPTNGLPVSTDRH